MHYILKPYRIYGEIIQNVADLIQHIQTYQSLIMLPLLFPFHKGYTAIIGPVNKPIEMCVGPLLALRTVL